MAKLIPIDDPYKGVKLIPIDGPKQPKSFGAKALDVAGEFASAANRAVLGAVDFVGPDQINNVLEITGHERSFPTLLGSSIGQQATTGNFMEPGLARDAVRAGGEILPAAVATGAGLRSLASRVPAVQYGGQTTGQGVLQSLGNTTPTQDAVGGALAGVGGAVGHEYGGEPGGLLGAVTLPAAILGGGSVIKEGIRRAFRGGAEGQRVLQDNIADFAVVGRSPTVGTGTNSTLLEGTENILQKLPGGGPLSRHADDVVAGMSEKVGTIASELSPRSGDWSAGRVLKMGIDKFLERFNGTQGRLWQQVDDAISPNTQVSMTNTARVVNDKVNSGIFADIVNSPKMLRLKVLLDSGKPATYEDLRVLRTTIGEMIGDVGLVSDTSKAQLKQLYGALSDDIKAVAASQGDDVLRLFERANWFTRSGHDRINDFLSNLHKKVDYSKIYDSVVREADSTQYINSVKRSLTPDEWNAVVGQVIRRMGQANPGQQGAAGETFSFRTFLTNWNRMHAGLQRGANVPETHPMFSGSPLLQKYSRDLHAIARVAERMKLSEQQLANPSGTGPFIANLGAGAAAATLAATGQYPQLAVLATGVLANNGATRLMSSPMFVGWLAQSTKVPASAMPQHIAKLAALARGSGLEAEIDAYIQQLEATKQPAQ